MATISPLDNRYSHTITDVIKHFDIFNFTKCKLLVECEYLKFFCSIIGEQYDSKTINAHF